MFYWTFSAANLIQKKKTVSRWTVFFDFGGKMFENFKRTSCLILKIFRSECHKYIRLNITFITICVKNERIIRLHHHFYFEAVF
jgi:hypothetical protein